MHRRVASRSSVDHPGCFSPGAPKGYVACRARLLAELDDVRGGRALGARNHVELHPLALGEALEPLARDGGVVDEAVLLAVLRGDEPEALGVVEPLHGTGGTHAESSFVLLVIGTRHSLAYRLPVLVTCRPHAGPRRLQRKRALRIPGPSAPWISDHASRRAHRSRSITGAVLDLKGRIEAAADAEDH